MVDVLFINAQRQMVLAQEVNGTLLLGTKLLQAGFETQVLRFGQIECYHKDYNRFIENAVERVAQIGPRAVSFYTLWPYYHVILRLAKEIRRRLPQIYIVLGGPQSSATARDTMEAMDYIDFVCTGEGEHTVVPFFEALLRRNGVGLEEVPGLFRRENGAVVSNSQQMPLCDLNTLPHWDDRLYLPGYPETNEDRAVGNYYMPIDAGRGCPYNCSFCCSSYFWRRTYRLKSPERIVEDIRYYYDRFGIRSFWFSHDAFTTDRKLVSKVCDHIIESGLDISWKCSARVDCINEELIEKMIQSGLTEIELGIETGSERMQKLIHKNLNLERARKMISFLVKKGLFVSLFFMFGFPEETEEDLNQTLELMLSMVDRGVQRVDMFFCRFNPATEITERFMDRLVLDPKIKILSRAIFGYEQEVDVIGKHRSLFPYFYHLDTPVRNDHQYLLYLVHLYQRFPNSIKYLRRLYQGDNLKFYRDFYESNLHIFDRGTRYVRDVMEERPLEFVLNMLKNRHEPFIPQLRGLLRFVHDVQKIKNAREDMTIRDTYSFNFMDFQMRKPLEQYAPGQTEFLLQRVNGQENLRVLKIQ